MADTLDGSSYQSILTVSSAVKLGPGPNFKESVNGESALTEAENSVLTVVYFMDYREILASAHVYFALVRILCLLCNSGIFTLKQ